MTRRSEDSGCVVDAENAAEHFERRGGLQIEVDAARVQCGEQLFTAARFISGSRAKRLAEKRAGELKICVKRRDGAEPVAGVFVREHHAHGERELGQIGGDGGIGRGVAREPVLRELVGRLARKVADKRRLDQKQHGGNGQNGDRGVLQMAHERGVLIHGNPPRRWAG